MRDDRQDARGAKRKRSWSCAPGVLAVSLSLLASSQCAPSGFENVSQVDSVRIFATAADQPYAAPGAKVNLSVLAFDGRATQPEPMRIYWLPLVCENPQGDAYYGCFKQLAAAQGGGGTGSGGGTGMDAGMIDCMRPQPGQDLTPCLPPAGPAFSFTMPADAVTSHPVMPGVHVPYGLVILFNIACAGHLELLSVGGAGGNPAQPPIGCFHQDKSPAPPTDYVIGYTRVYAYDTLTNANPVIDHVQVQGQPIDLQAGFGTPSCPSGSSCPGVRIGPVVPPSSQESNPEDTDAQGNPRKEEIWADYYATFGSFDSDARLLYDPTAGAVDDADNTWRAPGTPGDGTIWIVVHDNRGGTSWATVPVHVQ
jgi:hypothetical protein